MAIRPLNIVYTLLDKEIGMYSKTGIYHVSHDEYEEGAIVPEDDPEEWFMASYGIPFVDVKDGDKISIGLFGKNGGMFAIYNHNNELYEVFPKAVDDLYYILNLKGSNFIQEYRNNRKIKKAVEAFPNSSILRRAIAELKRG